MVCRLYLAYGYMYLPENKYLGDYYSMISLLFSLSYLSLALEMETEAGRFPLVCLNRPLFFFHDPRPPDLHRYYIIYKSEMDIFALMLSP